MTLVIDWGALVAEPDGKLVGGGEPALGSGDAKVPAVGAGLKMASSERITRSGWSLIAESTIILVICCSPGFTSIGDHNSSSTSFADLLSRV